MTREEALKILKDCRRRGFEHTLYYIDEYHTAMDMAIEATTKNDLAGDIMDFPNTFDEFAKHHQIVDKDEHYSNGIEYIPVFRVKQWLEHISTTKNDLGVEQYRERLIEAFHNADCDSLIALVVQPTEKEFKHLEWLLKNHYKHDPCEDAISRQAVEKITWEEPSYTDALNALTEVREKVRALPPVTPHPKIGHWIQTNEFFINQDGQFIYKFICSECKSLSYFRKSNKKAIGANVCPNCGTTMIEPQESEDEE